MTGFREYRTRQEMTEHGWKINPLNSECRNCGAEITWATSPNGKKLPLDVNSTSAHFKSCSNGGAPESAPASSRPSAPPLRANNVVPSAPTAADFNALRESIDELAQATRAMCSLLRSRAEAK